MNFAYLKEVCKKWDNLLVIGRDIQHEDQQCHIIGVTLDEEMKLYIIEPYIHNDEENGRNLGIHNRRRALKENNDFESCYMQCRELVIGTQKMRVLGGTGSPLRYSSEDYSVIQLFMQMINAGWTIPEWLEEEDWYNLQLVTLDIEPVDELPHYTSDMPISMKIESNPIQHILEKTVTLNVGKSKNFSFVDSYGDEVQCYINHVVLIDVWKEVMARFDDPRFTSNFSEEELKQVKDQCSKSLEQCCPKGMYYIGVEYECTKEIKMQFYSKEYLKTRQGENEGSASFMAMSLKPDEKTGAHGLPMNGCVIQTPVSIDTAKIAGEAFCYYEKGRTWEEIV